MYSNPNQTERPFGIWNPILSLGKQDTGNASSDSYSRSGTYTSNCCFSHFSSVPFFLGFNAGEMKFPCQSALWMRSQNILSAELYHHTHTHTSKSKTQNTVLVSSKDKIDIQCFVKKNTITHPSLVVFPKEIQSASRTVHTIDLMLVTFLHQTIQNRHGIAQLRWLGRLGQAKCVLERIVRRRTFGTSDGQFFQNLTVGLSKCKFIVEFSFCLLLSVLGRPHDAMLFPVLTLIVFYYND
mmetsp:Transcript_30620/g.57343  ORF Transcript_30620/g.57343 Transcript_30620/m.57343 type:complete len:239 (-) Transcript_30620:61-777(-)